MSAIIAGLLPKIEGFQPIPNAVMIPFMEAQSAALAYGFGLNYEYGKRKIRSMSNDEYNSLTSDDITNMSNEHTHIILSKFQAQVPHVMPMQEQIFTQYVIIEKAKVKQNFELFQWIIQFVAQSGSQILQDALAGYLGGRATDAQNQPSAFEQWKTTCTPGSKFLKDDGTTVDCPNTTTPSTDYQGESYTSPPPPTQKIKGSKRLYVTYNYRNPPELGGKMVNKNSTITANQHISKIKRLERDMIDMSRRAGQSYDIQYRLLKNQYVAYSAALSQTMGQHWQTAV